MGDIKNCYDVSYIEKRYLCLSIYYYYYIVYTIQCYYIVVGCYNNGEFIFGLFLSATTIYYYYIVYTHIYTVGDWKLKTLKSVERN